jgi:hypothetical protein
LSPKALISTHYFKTILDEAGLWGAFFVIGFALVLAVEVGRQVPPPMADEASS